MACYQFHTTMKIAVLPGDGIGTEIVTEAVKVLKVLELPFEMETALVGGAAYEAHGHPLPESTLSLAKAADAVLFGAVGDWKYDKLDRPLRPEQAILGLRKNLGLFANFRPAICYEQLVGASSLKPELIAGLDILIIRELTGDIYFGQPRGRRTAVDGHFPGTEEAFDTMRYSKPEIERIAHVAFQAARKRNKKVTSVDKANVLETFQFWKDVVTEVHAQYPDVQLEHMYVDNAAMQLVKKPKAFDVVVTGNNGIKPGIVLGKTDDFGFYAVEDKVHVHDLHATILHLFGIEHTKLTYRFQGRDFRLTDVHGQLVKPLLA